MSSLRQHHLQQKIEKTIDWNDINSFQDVLENNILPSYLPHRRWFRSKTKTIQAIKINQYPNLLLEANIVYLLCIHAQYTDATQEDYFLPIMMVTSSLEIGQYLQHYPQAIICVAQHQDTEGIMIDAAYSSAFQEALFHLIQEGAVLENKKGKLLFEAGSALMNYESQGAIQSKILGVEQTNSSIIYNDAFFLKIYRKLECGINTDLELVRFLSEKTNFKNAPQYGGSITFIQDGAEPVVVGLMQNKINNIGDAWNTMLVKVASYYERVMAQNILRKPKLIRKDRLYFMDVPADMRNLIGRNTYQRVVQLAQRTAEMHLALSQETQDLAFTPQPLDIVQQQRISKDHFELMNNKLSDLAQRIPEFSQQIAAEAQAVLSYKDIIVHSLQTLANTAIEATQIRVHGDYHLGQVLDDGEDFYIIDFEGEPMRSIEERRAKATPFKDVAGMIRSFHYAAYGQLYLNADQYEAQQIHILEQWASYWFHYVSQFYLTAYLDKVKDQSFIPKSKEKLTLLLRTFVLEKAIYEVGYEMNARPDWLRIPLRGVLHEIEQSESTVSL